MIKRLEKGLIGPISVQRAEVLLSGALGRRCLMKHTLPGSRTSAFRATTISALLITALSVTAVQAAGDSALIDAVRAGDVAAVQALLRQKGAVNAAQPDGMTALHWA